MTSNTHPQLHDWSLYILYNCFKEGIRTCTPPPPPQPLPSLLSPTVHTRIGEDRRVKNSLQLSPQLQGSRRKPSIIYYTASFSLHSPSTHSTFHKLAVLFCSVQSLKFHLFLALCAFDSEFRFHLFDPAFLQDSCLHSLSLSVSYKYIDSLFVLLSLERCFRRQYHSFIFPVSSLHLAFAFVVSFSLSPNL